MRQILDHGPALKKELKKFIATKQAQAGPADSGRTDFLRRLLPFATSGKLLRGSLLCFSYRAFAGQKPHKAVIDTAVALELIHSGLLIHDDVMDKDDFRRGQPSMQVQYAQIGKKAGLNNATQFGANMAICGGDMCLFLALELLSTASSPVHGLFADQLCMVCDGQMQDIYLQGQPSCPSKRAIYRLMKTKTAAYTVTLPLVAGATLAGQSAATTKQLRAFGDAVGMIFQIRDDELGIMGESKKTGKPVGADIREGKKTLIYYYLMKQSSAREKRQLQNIFGKSDLAANDITIVRKLIRKHQINRAINNEVKRLHNQALKVLKTLDLPTQYRQELKSLLTFCAKRQT